MKPVTALLRFHVRAGSALALRAGAPAAALLTAAVGLSEDPGATLQVAARNLARSDASPATAMILSVVAAGMAAWAAPRVLHGTRGWMRHLPADGIAHRRALLGALAVAQVPVGIAWSALWLLAAIADGGASPERLLAWPVVALGVAMAVLPARGRILSVAAGLGAAGLALTYGWPGIGIGVLLLVLAERWIVPRTAVARTRLVLGDRVASAAIPAVMTYRALGARMLFALIPALLFLGIAALFVQNNPGVEHDIGVRLATGIAIALVLAGLAEQLSKFRPPWRWARSLPWRAADRLRHDALWFAAHVAPLPAVFALLLADPSAWATLVLVPVLAIRAAGALRRPHRDAYTWMALAGEGGFLAAWFAVSPWFAVPALLLTWPAWRLGVRADRELDVSHWSPRESLAAGDPVSWRGA